MSMYFYLESQLDKLASCFFANEVREYESGEGSLPTRLVVPPQLVSRYQVANG